ncbi:MAG: tetratricopeptide repeat-containing protein [Sporolactobacillus laevolacticus]|nr:tetratricopeptide repeat-containing protein [Sporolactobacillus laevolacticus]
MKNKGKSSRDDGKLVMFPGLEERLLSKAMLLVEEKKYNEARALFGKMLELDERDVRGLYGWAVCSVELNDYREAEEAVVLLLEEDTPYYYDVFRLYLTILIERKDYKGALHEIVKVSKEKNFPPELKEFLHQMKKFCQLRLHEPAWNEVAIDEKMDDVFSWQREEQKSTQSVDWLALEKADSKNQMLLLRNLADQLRESHLPEIKRFLLDEKQHTEIKTMLLCAIKEGSLTKEIAVKKFGKVYRVQFESEEFLNKSFADQIEMLIRREFDSDNPTLAELAVDMERYFTMNVYPKPISPASVKVWAAVFSIRAMGSNAKEEEYKVLERFGVTEEEYQAAEQMLHEVEDYGIWS